MPFCSDRLLRAEVLIFNWTEFLKLIEQYLSEKYSQIINAVEISKKNAGFGFVVVLKYETNFDKLPKKYQVAHSTYSIYFDDFEEYLIFKNNYKNFIQRERFSNWSADFNVTVKLKAKTPFKSLPKEWQDLDLFHLDDEVDEVDFFDTHILKLLGDVFGDVPSQYFADQEKIFLIMEFPVQKKYSRQLLNYDLDISYHLEYN